ncbi:hypothetical protein B0H14DRAFT_3676625 [Mycena olivaceomarginata]|nr:hypothetical protein B0H14DRAFT_3676625 [Mycena olivaceomarginata]
MIFEVPAKEVTTIISACPAVENIYIFPLPDSTSSNITFDMIPPGRLHCPDKRDIPFESFGHPFFRNLTHFSMEISLHEDDVNDFAAWTVLSTLPRLTHLAIFDLPPENQIFESLHALVIHYPPSNQYVGLSEEPLSQDPRFVMTSLESYREGWQRGALTGEDFWARADGFIAKRISGEIPRRSSPLNIHMLTLTMSAQAKSLIG